MMVVAIFGCKSEKSTTAEYIDSDLINSELPEDFLSFYMKFHTDSVYQVEHIIFPLKMKSDSSSYLADEWQMHKPFSDHGGEYTQSFLNINGLIVEKIVSQNQIYKMERRFIKADDGYNLIYYQVDNAFRNSKDWEAAESS